MKYIDKLNDSVCFDGFVINMSDIKIFEKIFPFLGFLLYIIGMKKSSNKLKNPHHNECELQEVEGLVKESAKFARNLVDCFYGNEDLTKFYLVEKNKDESEFSFSMVLSIPDTEVSIEVGELCMNGFVDEDGVGFDIKYSLIDELQILGDFLKEYPQILDYGRDLNLDIDMQIAKSEIEFLIRFMDMLHNSISEFERGNGFVNSFSD